MNAKYSFFWLGIPLLALACSSGDGKGEKIIFNFPEQVIETGWAPSTADLIDYEDLTSRKRAYVSNERGEIIEEGESLNGLKEGPWMTYNDKGIPKVLTTYHLGKKQGLSLKFDDKGAISQKEYYHNDELEGECLVYEGNKLLERNQYANNQLNGISIKYYETGDIQQELSYVDGKMNGLSKWYKRDGVLIAAYIYEDGELVDRNPELSASDSIANNWVKQQP